MRRLAHIFIVLAALGVVHCGESPTPPAGPTPAPQPPFPSPGPVPTFSITGSVVDGWTLIALPGVAVTASGPAQRSAMSDENGRYTIMNLPSGSYTLTYTKPLFRARAYQPVLVFSDITHDGRIGYDVQSPVTAADLSGLWVGHGPYRDEPLWLTLIERGGAFSGLYQDRSVWSRTITGRRDGNHLWLRIEASGGLLTVEGDVLKDRCLYGVIKNEALGGNFPITFARGAPEFCRR